MLNRYMERLRFLLENLYISTNALGVGIVDRSGVVAAECGKLDISVISNVSAQIVSSGGKMLEFFTGMKTNSFSLWLKGNMGSAVVAPAGENLFIIIFYPKNVDVFYIQDNIERMLSDIIKVLIELKPYVRDMEGN